jgi:hypothetical protein
LRPNKWLVGVTRLSQSHGYHKAAPDESAYYCNIVAAVVASRWNDQTCRQTRPWSRGRQQAVRHAGDVLRESKQAATITVDCTLEGCTRLCGAGQTKLQGIRRQKKCACGLQADATGKRQCASLQQTVTTHSARVVDTRNYSRDVQTKWRDTKVSNY